MPSTHPTRRQQREQKAVRTRPPSLHSTMKFVLFALLTFAMGSCAFVPGYRQAQPSILAPSLRSALRLTAVKVTPEIEAQADVVRACGASWVVGRGSRVVGSWSADGGGWQAVAREWQMVACMYSLRTLTNSLAPSSLVRPRSAQIRYRDGAFVSSLVPHAHPTRIHQRTHSFTHPLAHPLTHSLTNPPTHASLLPARMCGSIKSWRAVSPRWQACLRSAWLTTRTVTAK